MYTLDEAYLSSLGSNPHDLIVDVHKRFVQPWGGVATKKIRNAYYKRRTALGMTVKDEGNSQSKKDSSEAQLYATRISTLFNREDTQEQHKDAVDDVLSDNPERNEVDREMTSPKR